MALSSATSTRFTQLFPIRSILCNTSLNGAVSFESHFPFPPLVRILSSICATISLQFIISRATSNGQVKSGMRIRNLSGNDIHFIYTAVVNALAKTPSTGFLVSMDKMLFIFSPAAFCRHSLIIFIP